MDTWTSVMSAAGECKAFLPQRCLRQRWLNILHKPRANIDFEDRWPVEPEKSLSASNFY
jgi:hypothetical protein